MNTSTTATLLVDLRPVHSRTIDGQLVSIYTAFWVEEGAATRVSAIKCQCAELLWTFHTREATDWQLHDDEEFKTLLEESQPWPNVVTCP